MYKALSKDFGPLDLAQTTLYCRELRELIAESNRNGGRGPGRKVIIHHTAPVGIYQANACVLMGAYMICELG